MSIKKKVFTAGLVAMMSLGFATGAMASDDGDKTRENSVDATLHSGGFELDISEAKSFGDITISLEDEKYETGFMDKFTVTDLRGLDDNWQLTVSSTPFQSKTNPAHVFPNVLTIKPLESIERVGNTVHQALPTSGLSNETVLDDGDVLIAKSNDGAGLGKFDLTFPENALGLVVSPNFKEGYYEPTLTWNLMSVPSN